MSEIILAGAGQIGFRHLQAISGLGVGTRIHLHDVDRGRLEYCRDNIDWNATSAELVLHETTASLPLAADLLVIATSAGPRRQLFDDITSRVQIKKCVLEKVLFQRRSDLRAVADVIDARSIPTWVNCTRRAWPGYRELRSRIHGQGPIHMTVNGGEWGLACNGIHYVDIFCGLSRESISSIDASALELPAIASKRPGYIEFLGTLKITGERGSTLTLNAMRSAVVLPIDLALSLPDAGLSMDIDEASKCLRIHHLPTGDKQSLPFTMIQTSQLTDQYRAILQDQGEVFLTPYAESAAQHDWLLAVFQKALGFSDDQPCSIT